MKKEGHAKPKKAETLGMPSFLVFRKLVSLLSLFRIVYWLFGGLLIIVVAYIFLTKRNLAYGLLGMA